MPGRTDAGKLGRQTDGGEQTLAEELGADLEAAREAADAAEVEAAIASARPAAWPLRAVLGRVRVHPGWRLSREETGGGVRGAATRRVVLQQG